MEDFPLLLLFFIFYLIAGSTKKKKKKKTPPAARRSPLRTRAQGEQADIRAAVRDRLTMAGFETAFTGERAQALEQTSDACGEKCIHLHDVSQTQMLDAAEGEDPCHFGGEAMQEAAEVDGVSFEEDSAQEALRQNVLRGVIMSEILTRPQQRRAMQRSRREYHG